MIPSCDNKPTVSIPVVLFICDNFPPLSISKIWDRMKKLNKGKAPPEFMSTHPSAENRIRKINEWINEIVLKYPPISN